MRVQNGYVVINPDVRGFGKSNGSKTLYSNVEARDYYNLIEWAAIQNWSNGKVGSNGVSYLAINQYKVVALRPLHLEAIILWECFSDFYRDLAKLGGIREDGFVPFRSKICLPEIRSESLKRELFDE